jgi:hypothetical protein
VREPFALWIWRTGAIHHMTLLAAAVLTGDTAVGIHFSSGMRGEVPGGGGLLGGDERQNPFLNLLPLFS